MAKDIRNIAIIAHVDHGKTSLVDQLFTQSGTLTNLEPESRLMDRMDQERERGITIAAKNCAIFWNDCKINILDTPGHADFGGEVERALSMVDGAILLVDASEGPLPQTRFVLEKALAQDLDLLLLINKVDRGDARPDEVLQEVYDLIIDLHGDERYLEMPVFYGIGREGKVGTSPDALEDTLNPLFDGIIEHIRAPELKPEEAFSMVVSDLAYSDFVGRLSIGRVLQGTVQAGVQLDHHGIEGTKSFKLTKLQVYEGIQMVEANEVGPGDICIIAGLEHVSIGDSIVTKGSSAIPSSLKVTEPSVFITFYRNNGPFLGKDGKYVQMNKISERLQKECLKNVSLRLERSNEEDAMVLKGRGEFQIAIVIEDMRREGYEFMVGRPQVVYRTIDGVLQEPFEQVSLDVDEEYSGTVTQTLSSRKGIMISMEPNGSGRMRLTFEVPARSLIGYRDSFLTETRGTGIMNAVNIGYRPYQGDLPARKTGSLVCDRQGTAVPYGIFNLEPRGKFFIVPGDDVYAGMVVGEHNREGDLDVNPTRAKQLTNIRAAGKDDNVILTPVKPLELEQAMAFLADDEVLEVTPKTMRIRKRVLDPTERKVAAKRSKKAQASE